MFCCLQYNCMLICLFFRQPLLFWLAGFLLLLWLLRTVSIFLSQDNGKHKVHCGGKGRKGGRENRRKEGSDGMENRRKGGRENRRKEGRKGVMGGRTEGREGGRENGRKEGSDGRENRRKGGRTEGRKGVMGGRTEGRENRRKGGRKGGRTEGRE